MAAIPDSTQSRAYWKTRHDELNQLDKKAIKIAFTAAVFFAAFIGMSIAGPIVGGLSGEIIAFTGVAGALGSFGTGLYKFISAKDKQRIKAQSLLEELRHPSTWRDSNPFYRPKKDAWAENSLYKSAVEEK